MQVTEFLKNPDKTEIPPVVVLHGSERYLRGEALRAIGRVVLGEDAEEREMGTTRFEGQQAELKSVCDELRTVSMWGERRLVIVDDADDFVSDNRSGLEGYVAQPAKKSVLVLIVKSWPKNTRLARSVAKMGLALECSELKGAALTRWLAETCRAEYGKRLSRDAAALMVELAGTETGLLNQELAKVSSYVGEAESIGVEEVRKLVGGWRAETTWAMTDAVRDGRLDRALACLEKLLVSGEAPQRILGGIGFAFRKYAQGTERARQIRSLREALKGAKVFPREVDSAAAYLRRVGRPRAERIYNRLLEADGNMKGTSRLPERLVLERLIVELGGRV